MRARRRLALIGAVALGVSGSASAEARPAAVVPLLSVNLDEATSDVLTQAIAEGLERAGAGPVRGGREVRRRLPPGGPSPDCPARTECVADLRDRLEADALVFVIATRVGEDVQVDPTVVRADAGTARPALRGRLEQLTDAVWLAPRVEAWLPAVPQVPPPPPPPAPPVAGADRRGWVAPSWPTWATAGFGVAALAVGTGLAVSANAMEGDLVDAGCLDRRCPDEDIDALSRRAAAADIAFLTGGVAIVAAVVLYLTVDGGPTNLSVMGGPRGAAVTGRF